MPLKRWEESGGKVPFSLWKTTFHVSMRHVNSFNN